MLGNPPGAVSHEPGVDADSRAIPRARVKSQNSRHNLMLARQPFRLSERR
jgi:hypothetical protein